jgi:hypothetical protein
MTQVVYGVFDNQAQADRALADTGASQTPGAVMLEGHFRDEELQIGATQALSGAIIMGLTVGITGAFIAWAFLWPAAGVPLSAWAMLPMALMGALFGVVAGGVAGAAEGKHCVRELAPEVDRRGRVVVTCEIEDNHDAELVRAAFERSGASRVAAA